MNESKYIVTLLGILLFTYWLQKRGKVTLFKNPKHLLFYFVTIFISGLIWDYFSVWQNIWIFPTGGTLGVRIGILPFEEYLFFLIVPYFGLTIYKVYEKRFK